MRLARNTVAPLALAALAASATLLCSGVGRSDVRHDGDWPEKDELVTLSFHEVPRAEAIRRLADQAGWSVVVEGAAPGAVDVQVKKQPASRVLDLILAGGDYRARRDGSLISIAPMASAAPPPAVTEPLPPPVAVPGSKGGAPHESRPHGKDRVVTGSSVRIEKDEVVGDLAVFGGSADVLGTVSGDISVFGGAVRVQSGAHVYGDVATFGGSVSLADGARVDGDVSTLGGSLDRNEKAIVGGSSVSLEKKADKEAGAEPERKAISVSTLADEVGGPVTRSALLFAFGAVLLALAGGRMDRLQTEVATRPMRTAALGVVGILVLIFGLLALCVTILGIPIAIIALFAAVFGLYAGVCAALTTLGAVLLRRKTSSPYVHLAVGCAIYLLLSSIPLVGGVVTALVVLVGAGTLVETRAAGFVPRGGGSYRPASV